jgi:hypothetical protein
MRSKVLTQFRSLLFYLLPVDQGLQGYIVTGSYPVIEGLTESPVLTRALT